MYELPPILMPDAKVWSDVFASFTEGKGGTQNAHKQGLNTPIGPHIGISDPDGYRYGKAEAVEEVYDIVNGRMVVVPYDTIGFKVTVRDDGSALVTAEYSQILGSHWLAEIDAATIPVRNEAAYA